MTPFYRAFETRKPDVPPPVRDLEQGGMLAASAGATAPESWPGPDRRRGPRAAAGRATVALAADVHVLIGRQQERDRAPADD